MRVLFQREVTTLLWDRRDATLSLHGWLVILRDETIIRPHIAKLRSTLDDYQNLQD